MGAFDDLTGRVFSRLTVIQRCGLIPGGHTAWLCHCLCGAAAVVDGARLKNTTTRSCGCLRDETRGNNRRKHGESHGPYQTREYKTWRAMIKRCTNLNAADYKRYGGRGILVCDRWRTDFLDFLGDMGRAPSPKHSIDRINNEGNYEPSNCRWATAKEQRTNQRPARRELAALGVETKEAPR